MINKNGRIVASQMTDCGIEKSADEVIPRPDITDQIAKHRVHTMMVRKLRRVPTANANIETYTFPRWVPSAVFGRSSILEVARTTITGPLTLDERRRWLSWTAVVNSRDNA